MLNRNCALILLTCLSLLLYVGCGGDSATDSDSESSSNETTETNKSSDPYDIANQPDDIGPVLAKGGSSWSSSDTAVTDQTVEARLHIWPSSPSPILGSSNRIRRLFYWRVQADKEGPRQSEKIHARLTTVDKDGNSLGEDDYLITLPVGGKEGTFELEVKSGKWKVPEATHAVVSINDTKKADDPVGLSNFVKIKVKHEEE